ncbi:MAG: SIMPL domain-containing protein [Nitrososphaerota archaeon]
MSSVGSLDRVALVAVVAAVVLVMAATLLNLQQRPLQVVGTGSETNYISVTGFASVKVVPDEARVVIGVRTRGETAEEASRRNAEAMSRVVDELRRLGLTERDMQTRWLSVDAEQDCVSGRCVVVGYVATNTIEVTLRSDRFQLISQVIDRSVAAGANYVQGVYFTVSEERRRQMEEDLMRSAIADAKRKAQRAAEELGVGIKGVLSVDLTIDQVPYPIPLATRTTSGPETPIVPGEVTVTGRVLVRFAIG